MARRKKASLMDPVIQTEEERHAVHLAEKQERAFEHAREHTLIEKARMEGTAAGRSEVIDPLANARARSATPAPQGGGSGLKKPSPSPEFVEADVRGTRRRIPAQVLDMPPNKQAAFYDQLESLDNKANSEDRFDTTAMRILDVVDAQTKRINGLESELADAQNAVYVVRRQMENLETEVEVRKSEALSEASGQVAQQVVHAGTVASQLRSDAEAHEREAQNLQVTIANQQQKIATTADSALGSISSQKKLSDLSKKQLEETVIELQSQVSKVSREQQEILTQFTNAKRQDRAAQDRQELAHYCVNESLTALLATVFNNSNFNELRQALGLNLSSTQKEWVENEHLFATGYIDANRYEERKFDLQVRKETLSRVHQLKEMPGVDELRGDPLALADASSIAIPDLGAAFDAMGLGYDLRDRTTGNWTVPNIRVRTSDVGNVVQLP